MKRIKIGDVFEVETRKGVAYFQCVKEAKATDCEVIRILPGVFTPNEIKNLENLVEEPEVFFIQFPLKYVSRSKCIKPVGNYPVPDSVQLPKYYRDKHIVRGEFIAWHIIDSETLADSFGQGAFRR